jgi:hypothetical protein
MQCSNKYKRRRERERVWPEQDSKIFVLLKKSAIVKYGIVFFIITQQNSLNSYSFTPIKLKAYYCYMFQALSVHNQGHHLSVEQSINNA